MTKRNLDAHCVFCGPWWIFLLGKYHHCCTFVMPQAHD